MESSLSLPPQSPCGLAVSTMRTIKRESIALVNVGEHAVSMSGAAIFQLDEFVSAHLSYKWLVAFEFSTAGNGVDINAAFVRRRAKTDFGIVSAVLLARLKNNLVHVIVALMRQAAVIALASDRSRIIPSDIVGAQVVASVLQTASYVGEAPPPPVRRRAPVVSSSSSGKSSAKRVKTDMVVKKGLVLVEEQQPVDDDDAEDGDDEDEDDDEVLLIGGGTTS